MEKKNARVAPLDPFRGAGGKGPAASLTAATIKRLSALKKRFYFHRPQTSCKAMEKGTLFFVRPSPPQGEVGLPAVLTFRPWPLTVRAPKLSNAERRRDY